MYHHSGAQRGLEIEERHSDILQRYRTGPWYISEKKVASRSRMESIRSSRNQSHFAFNHGLFGHSGKPMPVSDLIEKRLSLEFGG